MPALRIFIASPGDVIDERDRISTVVVPELRRIFGDEQIFGDSRIDLEAVRWETHSWPDVGTDAQAVINRQISDFDVLVGMMWKRFGTPTPRADSGTGEEFLRAYRYHQEYGRPKIMFYFRTAPFYTASTADWEQFSKVLAFRDDLTKRGVLFTEYDTPLDFERLVREHLVRQIFRLFQPVPNPDAAARLTSQDLQPNETPRRRSLRVFLVYAREDFDNVRQIYQHLRSAGFDPWLDMEDLIPGDAWQPRIRREIEQAGAILVFLSRHMTNRKGYVHKEVQIALDHISELPMGSPILIPVRLEPVEAPERLARFQWLDYFAPDGLERLVSTLDQIQTNAKQALHS